MDTLIALTYLLTSPPKVEKPTYRTEFYHHANFHADQCEIAVRAQKIHIVYRVLPWGATIPCVYRVLPWGATVLCYSFGFGKLSSSQRYASFDM